MEGSSIFSHQKLTDFLMKYYLRNFFHELLTISVALKKKLALYILLTLGLAIFRNHSSVRLTIVSQTASSFSLRGVPMPPF